MTDDDRWLIRKLFDALDSVRSVQASLTGLVEDRDAYDDETWSTLAYNAAVMGPSELQSAEADLLDGINEVPLDDAEDEGK